MIILLALTCLITSAGCQALPFRLPWRHEHLLPVCTGTNGALVLIAFAFRPDNGGLPVRIGWSFSAIPALIAGIAGIAGIAAGTGTSRPQAGLIKSRTEAGA
jgi:hypothetical protein